MNGGEMVYAPVSYTHLRAHETVLDLVCRLLLELLSKFSEEKAKLINFEQSTVRRTIPFGTRLDMQIYSNPKQMIRLSSQNLHEGVCKDFGEVCVAPVSYTHLTLPTIYSV